MELPKWQFLIMYSENLGNISKKKKMLITQKKKLLQWLRV